MTESKAVHPSSTLTESVVIPCGNSIALSEVQYMKALRPTDVTDGGRMTSSSRLMFLQIYQGTVLTLSPKVKEVTLELVL